MLRTPSARLFEDELKKRMGPVGLARVRNLAEAIAQEAGLGVVGRSHLEEALGQIEERGSSTGSE